MTNRYSWNTFPPVWIHNNESAVKQHHSYLAAKSGEPNSAYTLVNSLLNPMIIEQLAKTFDKQKPILVSVHAIEKMGVNAIPEALANVLAQLLGWTTDSGIIQGNGTVLGATVLTGKPHSANIALTSQTLERLRLKHGNKLEYWWQQRFGFWLDCLTESEARYLLNTPNVERIRNKITEASQTRDCTKN